MVYLTPRQKEIVNLLIQGNTDKEAAFIMGIKPTTVRKHMRRMIEKYQARTKLQAVIMFIMETKTE